MGHVFICATHSISVSICHTITPPNKSFCIPNMNQMHIIDYFIILAILTLFALLLDVFTTMDLESDITWPYEFKWLFIGLGLILSIMLFYTSVTWSWFRRLGVYGLYHSRHLDSRYMWTYDAQGLAYSTTMTRREDAYYEKTSASGFDVYLLKPKDERRLQWYSVISQDAYSKGSEESRGKMIMDLDTPPDIVNPLNMVNVGGLVWGYAFIGVLLCFVVMLLVYLEGHMDWVYMAVPYSLLCIYPWVLLFFQYPVESRHWTPSTWNAHKYHWLAISWIVDVVKNQERYRNKYRLMLLGLLCACVSIMFSYFVILDDLDSWGWLVVFIVPIAFIGVVIFASVSKMVHIMSHPGQKTDTEWFQLLIMVLMYSTFNVFLILLWVRVSWAAYEWGWCLVPFGTCCLVTIISIVIVLKQDDTPHGIIKNINRDEIMTIGGSSSSIGVNTMEEDTQGSSVLPNQTSFV